MATTEQRLTILEQSMTKAQADILKRLTISSASTIHNANDIELQDLTTRECDQDILIEKINRKLVAMMRVLVGIEGSFTVVRELNIGDFIRLGAGRGFINGNPVLYFDDTQAEFANNAVYLPSNVDLTSNPKLLIKYAPRVDVASGTTARFFIAASYTSDGETYTKSPVDEFSITDAVVSGTAHTKSSFEVTLDASKMSVGDRAQFWLARVADATEDDRNGDVYVAEVYMTYDINTLDEELV